jgi:D-alanyl-lipoteichoic acid acyltransferase DltB (MBOAT superfamily)
LLIASCYFYITFLPIYILILFFTIVIDYYAGIWIEQTEDNERKQRAILIGSVILNIAVLALFKYWDFLINSINVSLHVHLPRLKELWLSGWIVRSNNAFNDWANHLLGTNYPILENVILPLGLSFHTFQALAYLLEIYRGNWKAERHFGIYAVFVMFYPQLVAGPIERPQHILPQFRIRHKFNWDLFWSGIRLMLWGFFKKVVIADRLSQYVDIIYHEPMTYTNAGNVLLAFIFFLVQVYCDFSGYSEIALGAARTMGFSLMINFNRPLMSRSISEFWRRWHISLSSWFNDYLFTAISASARRLKLWGIVLAVMVTFALSGLWHGAAWTFVIFGMIHGSGIVYEILTRNTRAKIAARLPPLLWSFLCWATTISFVTLAVVFFRANSFGQAIHMLQYVVTLNHSTPFHTVVASGNDEFGVTSLIVSLFVITVMFLVERKTDPMLLVLDKRPKLDVIFSTAVLVAIIMLGIFQKNTFIYFQF